MNGYRYLATLVVCLSVFVGVNSRLYSQPDGRAASEVGILVMSKTPDYRHDSIPAGNEAIKKIGRKIEQRSDVSKVRVDIVDSEGPYSESEPVDFPSDAERLKSRYDVLVFNNSNDSNHPESKEILLLNDQQQAAFREFIESGGGFVGIHSAVDNMTADSFFSRVLGAYYTQHAKFQEGRLQAPDRVHPSTKRLPVEWKMKSEWYTFQENPRGDVHVLVTADESSYDGKGMNGEGHLHPVSWCHRVAGGRSWYTALGHSSEQFRNKNMLNHLLGGINWAAGITKGQATGTVWNAYRKIPLDTNTESPATLDIAPDGRVFYVDRRDYNNDRTDYVMVIEPEANETRTALELPVSAARIYGLKDLLLDPDFEKNGWIYLFYVPPSDANEKDDFARVSRFTVSDGTIRRSSEEIILKFPVDPELRGHLGGNMDWGPNGRMLYISVGDDTQIVTGYTPIDERDGRALYDAQRSSGNTADLRGSILRIIPLDDGSYKVPSGNLFTPENGYASELERGVVRPEIYAMGMRNPYRITVDPKTGVLYWGDYGPDAGDWHQRRGPLGMVEYNRTDEPGFFGWPYLVGNNIPYRDFDFDTEMSGEVFSPSGPVNDSPNNTGMRQLPAGKGTMITSVNSWEEYLDYPAAWNKFVPYETMDDVPFPQIKGGAPMQGPVYRFQGKTGTPALPPYFEGKVFIMERGRNWLKYVTLDESGNPVTVEPFLPDHTFIRPMDMEVGPEGGLYIAEWGSGYEGPNENSGIYRIEHRSRTAGIRFHETSDASWYLPEGGAARLTVTVTNRHRVPISSGRVALQTAKGASVQVKPEQQGFNHLQPGQSTEVSWTLSAAENAGGEHVSLVAKLQYTSVENGSDPRVLKKQATIPVTKQLTVPFGLNLGGDTSIEAEGITFHGTPHPQVQSNNVQVSGTGDSISGTDHPELYQTLQYGSGLSYEIPVSNGTYDVTFYFLENHFNDEGKRVFSVGLEGETVIHNLDIYSEVGHDAALQKTIERVRVTDGRLSVTTNTHSNHPSISGIAVRSSQREGADTAGKDEEVARDSDGSERTLEITAGDDMVYDREEFAVSPGQTVRLTFKHTGSLPVQAMGHNVVILNDPELNPVSFGRKASGNGTVENDYLPEGVQGEVLAATDLIGGGESDTITFTAPEKPGKYPFLCSFPQHAASMNGEMVVQE